MDHQTKAKSVSPQKAPTQPCTIAPANAPANRKAANEMNRPSTDRIQWVGVEGVATPLLEATVKRYPAPRTVSTITPA
ncbi:hypothetical protein MCERE1_02092 [Burkholderiaceae bacterium]